ncbi:MAG: endonuclease III domain-containing protein [Thermoplasmata archaeon]
MNSLKNKNSLSIQDLYNLLYSLFGPQRWWPAKTKFEVIVGAVLTQNTSWKNVEKSILNLKRKGLLNFQKMVDLDEKDLAEYVKSSGFYKQKAKRLKNLVMAIKNNYGTLENFLKEDIYNARNFLLSNKGIGKETADSIILYAIEKPIFVVDAYTLRIFKRLGFKIENDYEGTRKIVEKQLNKNVNDLKEFHALLIELGKKYCKKLPLCESCPLNNFCEKNV